MSESKYLMEQTIDNNTSALVATDNRSLMVWYRKFKYATSAENADLCEDITKAYEKCYKKMCKRLGIM